MIQITSEKEWAPDKLPCDQVHLLPLVFKEVPATNVNARDKGIDAVLEVSWKKHPYLFGASYKRHATPRLFNAALNDLVIAARRAELRPLLIVPYLSEDRLSDLEQRSISGIDLCGNGIVVVPDKLFVFRSGARNRFSTSVPIKNIYRKSSSLVARVFLECAAYKSVGDIYEEILRRGGRLSLATVSRVLKVLEDELIIGRQEGDIRLLQAEKLLTNLVANFEPPEVKRSFSGKVSLPQSQIISVLSEAADQQDVRIALSGAGSAGRYAVMATEETLSVYCTAYDKLLPQLPVISDTFFPNLTLQETTDETAYFDVRHQNGYPWASPIQTYLELMTGEKRDRETAEQLRSLLLRELTGAQKS